MEELCAMQRENSLPKIFTKIVSSQMTEFNKILQQYKLTYEQMGILCHLFSNGDGVSQKNIAHSVYKDQANITRIINRLISKQFVIRKKSPNDMRENLIFITDYGIDTMKVIHPMVENIDKKYLSILKDGEFKLLQDLLNKILLEITV